jgi:Cof subfamily protein (haloacid dehalogenase superfamily)
MVRMIVMDLDGTLLTSDKNISDYSVSILEKCKNEGIKIVIATARSEKSAERIIKLINPDIMILNGGSLAIKNDGKIIYKRTFSVETSDGILNEFKNNKNIGMITIETINNYYVSYENVAWHSDYMHGIYYDFSKQLSEETYKITVEIFDNKVAKNIGDKFAECKIVEFTGENWYGIYHKEANKMLALEAIIKDEKIELENIVAFGDDHNDIEMVKKCGIGIAMENGIDEIKNVAKNICGNNNEDGVAKWIEENI